MVDNPDSTKQNIENIESLNQAFFLNPQEIIMPEGISCPEGMWIRESWMRLGMKKYGADWGRKKIREAAWALKDALIENPAIEVFTIDSKDGMKEPLNRDWLRGRGCTNFILLGFRNTSYRQDGLPEGKIIYVNRLQFESYLEDKPFMTLPANGDVKKRIRRNELHECIGAIITDIKQANHGHKPSGADVWNEIKRRKKDFDFIQSIETDQKAKEEAIYWISARGVEQKMLKSRFINVVSEFNTGKKHLPE